MDKKPSAQLDPKMQEAYDRVMGVQIPQTTPAQPVAPTLPPSQPAAPIAPSIPAPQITVTPSDPTPTTVAISSPSMPEVNKGVAKPHAFIAKKGMKIPPLILIIGGIAFLLVYTVIWIKVFNLSVPFINQ